MPSKGMGHRLRAGKVEGLARSGHAGGTISGTGWARHVVHTEAHFAEFVVASAREYEVELSEPAALHD